MKNYPSSMKENFFTLPSRWPVYFSLSSWAPCKPISIISNNLEYRAELFKFQGVCPRLLVFCTLVLYWSYLGAHLDFLGCFKEFSRIFYHLREAANVMKGYAVLYSYTVLHILLFKYKIPVYRYPSFWIIWNIEKNCLNFKESVPDSKNAIVYLRTFF